MSGYTHQRVFVRWRHSSGFVKIHLSKLVRNNMTSPGIASKIQHILKSVKGFEKLVAFGDIKILSAGNGNCVGEIKVSPEYTNIYSGIHGGFATSLIDVLTTAALYTHDKGASRVHVSVNLNIEFMKSAKLGDTLIIDAKTLKVGGKIAFLEAVIKNKANGDLLVKGSHTKCLLDIEMPQL